MDCKITTKNSYTQIFSKENTFFRVFSSFCQLHRAFRSHFCSRCCFIYFAGYYTAFSVHFPRHFMPAIVFVPFRRIIFAALPFWARGIGGLPLRRHFLYVRAIRPRILCFSLVSVQSWRIEKHRPPARA